MNKIESSSDPVRWKSCFVALMRDIVQNSDYLDTFFGKLAINLFEWNNYGGRNICETLRLSKYETIREDYVFIWNEICLLSLPLRIFRRLF